MTLHIGMPEGERAMAWPKGLRELWVRTPTDLFDPSVPITIRRIGSASAVEVPPGCDLFCNPLIEPGTAFLVFQGGRIWTGGGRMYTQGNVKEVKGRKRQAFIDGGRRKTVVLTKVPSFGVPL